MTRLHLISTLLLTLALASCDGESTTDAGPRDAGPRVDTGPGVDAGPGPDAGPGVDAGPRIDAGMDCSLTVPSLAAERVAPGHGFDGPLFLTVAPGSTDLFIVEQRGRIQRVSGDTVTEFLDIEGRVNDGPNERGLLGLAFHPDYETNGRFFVYYTPNSPDTNRVAEYARDADDPSVADDTEVAVLVDIDDPASNHNGGMLAFGPDGFLYAGTGDGGNGGDPFGEFGNGLNTNTLMGKILRLDVDAAGEGYAAAGNPFVDGGGLPQIWAYGLRNPWRFSFDRDTGDLWIGDVGQNMWEEIDFQAAGTGAGDNYGWRAYEAFEIFSAPDTGRVEDHHEPVIAIRHNSDPLLPDACSITGGYVYRGSAIPDLQGWYLFSDFCSSARAALRVCDGEPITEAIDGLEGVGGNIKSFGEDTNGELYLVGNGVWRIIPE